MDSGKNGYTIVIHNAHPFPIGFIPLNDLTISHP
jgi:hypothetical protein